MSFSSLPFLVFILLFFPLYFGTKGRVRTWVCLLSSYVFYGWWDWRFLSLIIFSTVMDWWFGLWLSYLDRPEETRRSWENGSPVLQQFGDVTQWVAGIGLKPKSVLLLSMAMNLGFLGFFKYFNFFTDGLAALVSSLGMTPSWTTLNIILPVGISFYTFQSMSYTIDVYRKEIPWEPSLLKFATFIALFPQLVAGPIVRAADFLHQMNEDKRFNWQRWHSGMGRVLWGFFKKIAVADSLAPFVEQCFQAPETFGSMHLWIGVVFYSFQIYCDFSGYSDIAIGLARMMGYDFPENFRTPYFSRSFSEFWTRWHISLSSWLRDYLYIPLGGNRGGKWATYRNNMLTMLLGGLWHGANLAFVFWGFLHGLYLILQRTIAPVWRHMVSTLRLPGMLSAGLEMATVYALTLLAWVYFRSGSVGLAGGDSFGMANAVLSGIFSGEGFRFGAVINKFQVIRGVFLIGILLTVEISNIRVHWNQLQVERPWVRLGLFSILAWLLAFLGNFGSNAFIYFQF
ncbi:MAG TPA: membrane-bound O-acyltransferase family protein [Saprospirales bacterium]|nr:membrane-bound O-acyltransferase family protein [Saprospirales bacterium]